LVAAFAQGGAVRAQSATPAAASGEPGYVVIRRYHVKPNATFAEVARRVEEGFVPIVRAVPGFLMYLLVETGSDELVVVSAFTDQAGADESATLARNWAEENVGELLELPAYESITGPVGLSELAMLPAS
jgi:quinol monooxygenase YgiN